MTQPQEKRATEPIEDFLAEWTAAERDGDTQRLGVLLSEDFVGVGPLGFVLTKAAWVGRHRQGLTYQDFDLEELQIRQCRDVAVAIARNTTLGTYQGQPVPEAARATLIVESKNTAYRLAGIHLSFIASIQGSPPLPTAAGLAPTAHPLGNGGRQ